MFKNYTLKIITILAALAVIGIGSNAFAEWGGGYGHHGYGMMGDGYQGYGMMGDGYHGYGMMGDGNYGYGHHGYGMMGDGQGCYYGRNLTREEAEALDNQARAFDKDTAKLREDIYQKQVALARELDKDTPDAKTASKLQQEISDLRARFDQKRVEYQIKTRKTVPDAGRHMTRGYGRHGYGDCWR